MVRSLFFCPILVDLELWVKWCHDAPYTGMDDIEWLYLLDRSINWEAALVGGMLWRMTHPRFCPCPPPYPLTEAADDGVGTVMCVACKLPVHQDRYGDVHDDLGEDS